MGIFTDQIDPLRQLVASLADIGCVVSRDVQRIRGFSLASQAQIALAVAHTKRPLPGNGVRPLGVVALGVARCPRWAGSEEE